VTRPQLWLGAVVQFVILAVLCLTSADADLWGHVTFGSDILTSGHVVQPDRYSFTSDLRWINHEWLSELAMAAGWRVAGAIGLTTLKLAMVWGAGALVLAAWRPFQLTALWRDGLLFVIALGVWPLAATIRPQAFSLLLFTALLYLLSRPGLNRHRVRLAIPCLFAVWVNTHGGWLVGAGVLAIFTGAALIDRAITWREKGAIGLMALASGFGCLINPYGLDMLGFLATTVRPDRTDVIEWHPITTLPLVVVLLWSIPFTIAAWAFLRRKSEAPLWQWLVVAMLAVGSIRVARLAGFFALAVGLLVAPLAAPRVGGGKTTSASPGGATLWLSLVAFVLAIAIFGRHVSMDGAWAPEPGAAEFVRARGLRGRLLTWFDYGEYAIWHFSPALTVSMDGRRETVYSQTVRDRHMTIYRAEPGALVAVAEMRPDYIWLPKVAPVIPALEAAGWHLLYVGDRSAILGLESAEVVRDARSVPGGRRFPGP
jgi:hypothetical protein